MYVGRRFPRQRGQAMVFSLIFMAVTVITMMVLYNQGLLVRHRMQAENASDAAVYSVAKLSARHMNLSAHLNRALVANDVFVGQISGLVSSLGRYANMRKFVASVPPYHVSIGPTGVTINGILAPVLGPISKAFDAVGKTVAGILPGIGRGTAGLNKMLGFFDTAFAAATVVTQFTAANAVIAAHANAKQQKNGAGPQLPPVGYFFLANNIVQTYINKNKSVFDSDLLSDLYETNPELLAYSASGAPTQNGIDHVQRYYADNKDVIGQSLIGLNYPDKMGDGAGQEKDEQHRYAGIVNQNRGQFLIERDSSKMLKFNVMDVTIITAELKIDVEFGFKANGGSLYRFKKEGAAEKYGWTSLDMAAIGAAIYIYANFEPDLLDLFPFELTLPIGIPLGGWTNQTVDTMTTPRLKSSIQWFEDGYGGVMTDPPTADNLAYMLGIPFMETLGLFGRGGPGGAPKKFATKGAGGMPSFWSVNSNLRSQDRSPPFAIVVIQNMDTISTTDNFPGGDIGSDQSKLPKWADVSLSTKSVGENGVGVEPVDAAFSFLTGAKRPIMSLSSAELYHKRRDTLEKANLFSPFWDARLVENGPLVVTLLKTLEDPGSFARKIIPSDPTRAAIEYLKATGLQMIDDTAADLPAPFRDMAKDGAKTALESF